MSIDYCAKARQVFAIEAAAINGLNQYLDQQFANVCQQMFNCAGRVIVVGMGKSGHIANKIAATLASTPACLL